MKRLLLTALGSLLLTTSLLAQSESGLIVGAEAEKKINKQLSVSVEGDFRTRNDFKTIDRWSGGLGAQYKFNKWLKADAGYDLLYTQHRENITYNRNSAGSVTGYNNWRPSYWGIRHRLHASLAGTYKLPNNIRLSLRERWQYTYRPEKTVTRWDFDIEKWEDKVRGSKGKSVLRSRLQVEYDKKKALFTPYANVELYNSWGIDKVRYTVGTDVRLSKQHSLGVYYRFQDMRHVDADEYDPDMHYLGVGYKFKF